jgi:hypothetical protein
MPDRDPTSVLIILREMFSFGFNTFKINITDPDMNG